jgi:hypothetical protein
MRVTLVWFNGNFNVPSGDAAPNDRRHTVCAAFTVPSTFVLDALSLHQLLRRTRPAATIVA